jgi:4'-phosphopantetheinyl transferase
MSLATVSVYCADLDVEPARLRSLYHLLEPDERRRAENFRFASHRWRFIAGRGMLREILARHLEIAAENVRFRYNAHGKPSLPASDLCFNLSHSRSQILFAVARAREVGVDIECVDRKFAQEQIPERFFSPTEVRTLRSLPAAEQTAAFFRCWTRKEAYIKARGLGLALPLDSFDVSLGPEQPAALLAGAGDYTVCDVPAPAGFAAALVAQGSDWRMDLSVTASDETSRITASAAFPDPAPCR